MALPPESHSDVILRDMKISVAIAIALLASASAWAQYPYDRSLHRITPDRGPIDGGTAVTIEGDFNFQGLADPCAGPTVYVGGIEAAVTSYTDGPGGSIHFVTPAYTGGRFDVGVNRCGARAVMKNAFTYLAPDGRTEWERVLLPVYLATDVQGAFGSVWHSTLSGFSNVGGNAAVTGHPDFFCAYPSSAAAVTCFEPIPEGSFTPSITTDQHQPGRMIYIDPALQAKQIHLTLRVADRSREASSLGTNVPAVFEDDAYGPYQTFAIANIPLGTAYRQKLRLYRIDLGTPSTVNLFFSDGNASLSFRQITLSNEPSSEGFLLYPGYAELELDGLPELAGHAQADVLISVPLGRYWAYVSVTNNNTQEVTIVTP